MSLPQQPKPAKLVIGIFTKDKTLATPVAKDLMNRFGPMDIVSEWLPFDYTDYYYNEMGQPLYRRVFSFAKLMDQTSLAEIKCITNGIEENYSDHGSRNVNIDPGYLLFERFVLATGKNYSHRIYIGKGIYADLTLVYKDGGYQTLPWTYPDYAANNMLRYLLKVRSKYGYDLKQASDTIKNETS